MQLALLTSMSNIMDNSINVFKYLDKLDESQQNYSLEICLKLIKNSIQLPKTVIENYLNRNSTINFTNIINNTFHLKDSFGFNIQLVNHCLFNPNSGTGFSDSRKK